MATLTCRIQAFLAQPLFTFSAEVTLLRKCCRSRFSSGWRVWVNGELPVGDSVSEILTGDVDRVEFLSFLDFALDFVLFSERAEFLNEKKGTLALVQPVLAPYLFMAMKFFPGSLKEEGLNYSHPLTTRNEKWGTLAGAVFIFGGLSSIDMAIGREFMEAFFDLTELGFLEEDVFFSGHQL